MCFRDPGGEDRLLSHGVHALARTFEWYSPRGVGHTSWVSAITVGPLGIPSTQDLLEFVKKLLYASLVFVAHLPSGFMQISPLCW